MNEENKQENTWVRIGTYVFRNEDIYYLEISSIIGEPLDDGNDTELVIHTKYGEFLALLGKQQFILDVCDKICQQLSKQ